MAISHAHVNPLHCRVMSTFLSTKRKGSTAIQESKRDGMKQKRGEKDSPTRLELRAGIDTIWIVGKWKLSQSTFDGSCERCVLFRISIYLDWRWSRLTCYRIVSIITWSFAVVHFRWRHPIPMILDEWRNLVEQPGFLFTILASVRSNRR